MSGNPMRVRRESHIATIASVFVVAAVAALAPARAAAQGTPIVYVQTQQQYAQPAPVPVMEEADEERPNLALIIPGAVLLGVGWITNIIVGLPAGDDPFRAGGAGEEWTAFRACSIIPVVGPWIQLAVQPTHFDQDSWGMYLIIDGLLQTAGLTLLVVGIATPRRESRYARRGNEIDLAITPSAGDGRGGLTLSGRF